MGYGWASRVMRASRGLTQLEVANRAGLSPSTMSLLESGKRDPRLKTLERVAKGIGSSGLSLMFLAQLDEVLDDLSSQNCRAVVWELLR